MKESLVGLSEFRHNFVSWASALQTGEVEAVVILRNNKPSGVMLSYDRYQSIKSQPSLVAVPDGLAEVVAENRRILGLPPQTDFAPAEERERLGGEEKS